MDSFAQHVTDRTYDFVEEQLIGTVTIIIALFSFSYRFKGNMLNKMSI